jgi:hypothetical protein
MAVGALEPQSYAEFLRRLELPRDLKDAGLQLSWDHGAAQRVNF